LGLTTLTTILFTDIVDSTDIASKLGDRTWRELLERHDAAVRTELSGYRGDEINTMGDGFLASFDGPGRAIQAAKSIRDAVQSLGINVRIGLHTGECERHGKQLAGLAVHIGARVMSAAGNGEIFVSGTVCDLVAGSGIGFDDRGKHVLKGVPGEWNLHCVN
jgi:class 3 adenylate cyclase